MSCKCNQTPCCCRKRFTGNRDIKLIPGPQGPAGQDGQDGAVGPQGPPGTSGGLVYEWYSDQIADKTITVSEAVIPGSSHIIGGGDGDYQIHVDSSVKAQPGETIVARLYVNGVNVADTDFKATNSTISGLGGGAICINWRGNILDTQVVEVRMFTSNNGGWSIPAVMTRLFILINKEA